MTSSRIRSLIPHRRTRSGNESKVPSDSDEGPEFEERDRRKDSWYMGRRQKQSFKPVRNSSVPGIHDVFGPLPTPPNMTPRSSDSSLCSCGHNEEFASQSIALRRPCLCGLSSKNDQRDEPLRISSTTDYEDDRSSSQHSPESRHTNSPDLIRSSEESIESISSSNSKDSLPTAENTARGSSERSEPHLFPEEYSDNIQQLIQEADEAFKAVGSALAEVRLARYSTDENTPRAVTFEEPPPMSGSFLERPGPPTPDLSPILQSPLKQRPQPCLETSASPVPSLSPSASKRKKPKKQLKTPKVKSPKTVKARKPVVNKPAIKNAPRWTLTENVTELFSGRLFNRIEVDEMLTEEQLEEFKRRRISDLKTRQVSETPPQPSSDAKVPAESKSEDAEESLDTPVEPFHLEDLPSRIGSAGVKLTAETPVEEEKTVNPTFFYDDDGESLDFSVDRDELFLDEPSTTETRPATRSAAAAAASSSSSFITVPPAKKSLKGLMAGRKQPPGLPSIPEAPSAPRTPMMAMMDELFFDQQQVQQQPGDLQSGSVAVAVADADYVYLRSSPCTLTAPAFRHGPIRVAKADLLPEPTLSACGGTGGADDGGLDWTAFQMAILGGAGDWNSESDDTIRRRALEEIDELAGWWESWDFEDGIGGGGGGSIPGLGGLLTEDPELAVPPPWQMATPPSPTSTLSGGECSDVSYGDIKQDNPYSAHHRWQTLRRQAAVQGLGLPGPKRTSFGDDNDNDNNRDYRGRHSSKIYVPQSAFSTAALPPGKSRPKPKPKPLPLELGGTALAVDDGSRPRKTFADRESLASLPQSPMLDLHVIGGPGGDDADVDVVPMGYNLGHDLGDFLKWEAEHVYAYSTGPDVMM